MKELKKLQLNNKSLEEFDKLMDCHLDKIEELEINEVSINSKLYNLISLCTNLKQLVIKGDLRSDVNKVFFNICNPENIETIILDSVKLPTNKAFSKFSNISTISLNNINFSDLFGFFNRIVSPEKIIALNLTNVDFVKRPISICEKFENLKYLNLDNIKNCIFDDFSFIFENKKISRFEFYNNEIEFKNINDLLKGKFNKRIELDIKTNKNCSISNSLAIYDKDVCLTINSCDLENAIENLSFNKLSKLCLILNENKNIEQYIKKIKKSKANITLAINDICYLDIEEALKLKDELNLQIICVLQGPKSLDINNNKQCYSIEQYIKIRNALEDIKSEIDLENTNDLDKFNKLYSYFKNNIKYVEQDTDLKDVFLEKRSSYNFYAIAINSCLKILGFDSKVIKGSVNEEENHYWNQVRINEEWYNFDLAYELRAKENKKYLQYVFKSNLLNDEQFYKNHRPYYNSKPEVCYMKLQQLRKELKKEKTSIWNKIYSKIISIFKFNKKMALPMPDKKEK